MTSRVDAIRARGRQAPASARRAAPAARRPAPRQPARRRTPRPAGLPEKRQRWIAALVILVLVAFAARLTYVQLFQGPSLKKQAQDTRLTQQSLPAVRGNITDVNGVVLATSATRYTVAVDQRQVGAYIAPDPKNGTGVVAAAKALSPLLDIPVAELGADLNGTRGYLILKKEVLPEQWSAIEALKIPGISALQTAERVYPAGTTAGNVLGFVNSNGQGAGGLELSLDKDLTGTAGTETYEQGSGGQKIPDGEQKGTAAVPGDSVRLTLDQDIQWEAQDAVRAAAKKTKAKWVVAVVEDNKTGAILALADSRKVNPNDASTPVADRGSEAIEWTFPPGSTGKVITMAGLLQSGDATPKSKFTVDYSYTTPNGQTFHDSEYHGKENLTLAGILAQSSNAGTVHAGSRMSAQTQYDNMRAFGLGRHTGLGLPGEATGIVRPAADWDGRTRYAVLFGQGLTVNAAQVVSVYSTVANGGVRPPTHLVAGTTAPDGTYTPATQPKGTRVVSKKTASKLTRMLEGVVDTQGGTGTMAAVPGYVVAGKTGTAQVAGPSGKLTGIAASFVGFAPADNPRLTVGVFVNDPKTTIYGGTAAAPVFSKIMAFSLDHLGVAPSTSKADPYPTTW